MAKILFHFGEMSLKGKNRRLFEKRMARNIRGALKGVLLPDGLHREYGRMVAEVTEVSDALLEHIALLPGVRNFSLVHESGLSLEEMQEAARQAVLADYGDNVAGIPFRVSAKRSDKRFPLKSMEINYEVGGFLKTQLGLSVNLKHPQMEVRVEVGLDAAYIYTRKIAGIGGLPVGTSGKGVVLFSGGIDSPVAAYSMMKRGMSATLVHCYNSTINRDFAKIKDLARQLSRYQGHVKLYLVDLEEFQRHAIAMVPPEYRMIIYKRQMIREGAKIAEKIHAQALITGDSLGQVASQTLANIQAIYDASPIPLLSPLIASDKEEIIALARRIGTFDISTEEYCDICSFLIAKHPETHGRRSRVAQLEAHLPIDSIDSPVKMHIFDDGEEAAQV
ncbi:MAG: tRNA 4-thiouridine(8) synthase ThiI [Zetaproteobacteria bacterium CG12_big_fil_rev_8_21_14_0_65_55_1124]|nr:MAG: tRNA 4-thiouridine(8) synthase ThiI [Zetaproteobacteria bacterium CG1_02_55_237]PIS20284.1 MAG: tRNA 4-thiouridine(8) synthase ThiI [Zetaproteobacteria bacterium CG08_land_8_20_14_0_20_55_17]PIW43160.1 MAG: tRNA 4-thiouridine(8) synthase ThiI [Zetaproteobacteria bacterium CG12_big_fil_rev_8_21_14_0_65_55_1124]PIY52124.1 MAG: tRNA 4-thiouridine(8) synthase ThiI [Zetaproteobacteria bacterium CG_4_10_14_0_8_um_filter_55_43]PIZ38137.1 MAG: tRNA 4-thiouridine(8) synthase ThiI [Zetaproteobact